MTGKMRWPFAIEKTGTIGNVSGRGNMQGKRGVEAQGQRVALVVVEIAEAAIFAELFWLFEQAAGDHAGAFDRLIGVSQVNVEAFGDARRAHRGFPTVN